MSDETARATVEASWDIGVRWFDTAPHYGFGLSERRLGDVLRDKPRGDYILSTKVGRLMKPRAEASDRFGFCSPMPFEGVFDYSYDGVMRSFEDSLQRLGLSSIDLLLMHDIGEAAHGAEAPRLFDIAMEGGYRAMERLRQAGVVKAIGLGVNETKVCRAALGRGDWDLFLIAGRYTLLNQADEAGFFQTAHAAGVKVAVAGIYNSGILATGSNDAGGAFYDYERAPPAVIERVRRIEAVCARHDTPLPAAALQFAKAHPAADAVLIGVASPDQARQTAALAAHPIPAELWRDLRAEALIPADAPTPS
jgi:D-threo-aldose 1-dehydrogenase